MKHRLRKCVDGEQKSVIMSLPRECDKPDKQAIDLTPSRRQRRQGKRHSAPYVHWSFSIGLTESVQLV